MASKKARGQITIIDQKDSYTIHQSVNEYIFTANNNGTIPQAVSFSSVIKVTLGDDNLTNFTIGSVSKPAGFSSITVNNTSKTITYSVAANATGMADSGLVTIPVIIEGQIFTISFSYAKAKTGAAGVDSNMLDWVKDWNGGKTVIGSESVITPKIFAGVKNADNTITGIAIGKFALSTVNASGKVATETVNGVYGFKNGNKTFILDSGGNVQLGRGNQFVKYNAVTGKIEFGSEVTLNWVNAINTAKTEAINSAAATAQAKADAAKNAAIATAATDASGKVGAIRIAGRNYIRNSNFTTALTGITTEGTSISIDTATLYNNYRTLKVVQNTACTDSNAASQRTYFTAINSRVCAPASFSMYVKGAAASIMKIRIGGSGIRTVNITTAWQRVTIENITPTSAVVLFGFQTVGTYWCALPMLVEGSKAVDWSPAPEDVFTGITDAKKAGTDARTVADAITNKANTEGWATKLTYIGSTGIFTGTLSANTVNAVRINASQITAGTIDAARINVAALKTSLITAGNIEALALNVVRGKVGGWSIDADSIYRGTKNNTSGAYTGASGSVCIGSNGIRGFKWRLDATGAGAVAGGNISWDAAGNVTFGASVTLNWTNAANTAANNGKLYVRGTGLNHSAPRYISLNGTKVHESSSRGLVLSVINRSDLKVVSHTHYDVYANEANCNSLATAMNAIDSTKIVILSSFDAIRINTTLSAAIQRCGGSDYMVSDARIPYVLIGIPGIGKNMGLTSIYGLEATAAFAEISTAIVNGIPQGINADGKLKTYLSGTGIYTGTLTATQVNAVAINAGSITTGTLSADRIGAKAITAAKIAAGTITAAEINVSSIQASVVTATAVNGLTCTFSKGTIAGWHINASQIYKNNVYLGSDGSIYNGTKWKLNNDGSGRLANGNIAWDAAGNVTFASSVSLNWTNAATNALNSAKSYADTKKTEAISSAATDATNKANAAKELAQAMAFGRMLYRDPEFRNGNNSINVYNNNSNGTVTIARIGLSSAPNDSKTVLEIKTTGSASPGNGGFYFATTCSNRKVFITKIIAKIPVGRNLLWASNSIGTSGSSKWLTPNAGTGDWAEYIYKVTCGTSNFSSTNFFYLDGTQGTTAAPLIWHVAYATVFDTTSSEKYTTTIDANGIYTGTVRAGQVLIDSALVVGGSSYNGSISVRDAGNNVMATLDRTGITAVAGKIGGWNVNSGSIYASSPAGGHRVYITSSGYIYNDDGTQDYWGLRSDGAATFGYGKIFFDRDGSGYVADKNIKWDTKGNVEIKGNITANSGLIAGFTISGNKLVNTAADSSIEFTSMMGNASMTINSYSSLLSLRADSARTGIYLQTYAAGAKGIYIIANAGSTYAIESYGPMQLGQRAGERWCVPGVLYVGCKYSAGNSTGFSKIWGEGCNVTSCTHLGSSRYKFYHNLGHTNYTVFAQIWQDQGYYGFFRLVERATNYFVLQNLGSSGKPDGAAFDFVIFGRNKWY